LSIEVYLAVRARGLRSRLFSSDFFEKALKSSLSDMARLFSQSEYRITVEDLDFDSAWCMAYSTYINRVDSLLAGITGPMKSLVEAYSLGRIEVDLLRELLLSLTSNREYTPPECLAINRLRISPRALAMLGSLKSIVGYLGDHGYKRLGLACEEYMTGRDPSLLELALESDYYSNLWVLSRGIGAARKVLETEAIARLVHWSLLLRKRGKRLPRRLVEGLIENLEYFKKTLWSTRGEERLLKLSAKRLGVTLGEDISFRDFKSKMDRLIVKHMYSIADRREVDISYVLAVLFLAYIEAGDVYRLLLGKGMKVREDVLRKTLLSTL